MNTNNIMADMVYDLQPAQNNSNVSTEDMATIANLQTDILQEVLDDLNSRGGGTLQLGYGVYYLNRPLVTYSNITIAGRGELTVLDGSFLPVGDINQRPFLIRSSGSYQGEVRFSTNLEEGRTNLSVVGNLTELRVGMLLLIRSDERQENWSELPFKEELQRIVGINQNKATIEVDSGLLFNYTNQSNLSASIYEPTSNAAIKDLRINMGGVGSVHSGILFDYGYNINLDNVIVDGAESIGVQITRTYLFTIHNCHLKNSTSPLIPNFFTGYGLAIISSSCYGRIEENVFDNCRHGITGGNSAPHHINVETNIFTNCRTGYALGCHEPCMYWVMSGNTIQGCVSGINGRGMYLTISNNVIKNITGVGISVGGTEGIPLPFAKQYVISNNRITNTGGRAIELRGQFGPIKGAMIQENTCIKTLGILVRESINVLIHNNIVDQSEVFNDVRYSIHLVTCNNITILGNHLLGIGTHGIFSTNSIDVNISNNIFTPGRAVGQILNGVIRCAGGEKLMITNNQFQTFNRLTIFTSTLNHIIFVNNIITSSDTNNINFQDATNIINRDNMYIN